MIQRNQTSAQSIGLTRWNVATLFMKFFNCDLRNAIPVAKIEGTCYTNEGGFCFGSFLIVISLTIAHSAHNQLESTLFGA